MNAGVGPYRVMPRQRISSGGLALRAVEPDEIDTIRQWRNAQMDVLRQSRPISVEDQKRYFATHVWPGKAEAEPTQILLAVERHGAFVGYGGLVHISWDYRRAEVSFLLDPQLEEQPETSSSIFAAYLGLVKRLAFEDLGLERLTAETYASRPHVIATFEQNGFIREGRLRKHVVVGGRRMDALLHGCNMPARGASERNVLLTSASRKAPLLRAMQDAARRLDPDAQVIAGDLDPEAPTRHLADGFWVMPRTDAAEPAALIKGCKARGIGVILPTRDGELAFWARHRDAFAAAGIRVLVSSPEAVERCLDKLAFARFGVETGLPVIPASETPDALGEGPFVVKERFGAGALGVGLNLGAEAARAHARTLDAPLFQPFVTGPEISIDGWLGADGRAPGVVLRRRDRVIGGESQVTTTFRDPALEAEARAVLERLDLRGPAVMQAILTAQGMRIIEVNPRFGGASTLGIAAGLDTLFWSLAEAFGARTNPVFRPGESGLRQVRLPADIVFHDPDI